MSNDLEVANRINELTELLGMIRFSVSIKTNREVALDDIGVKVVLRSNHNKVYEMPMDFKPVVLAKGSTYTLALPIQVETNA